mmetsp:Transcript_22635/g.70287  ORF Transcript_22635/g.70287 Transcript_22635/m.70287 type:complete len:108 (-) Transcript_22635:53-376(-)
MYGIGRLYRRSQEVSKKFLGKEKRAKWSQTWREGFRLPSKVYWAVSSAPHSPPRAAGQDKAKSYSTFVAGVVGLPGGLQRALGPHYAGLAGVRGLHVAPLLPAIARA